MTVIRSPISKWFTATIIIDDRTYIHVTDRNRLVAMQKCTKQFNKYIEENK